MTVTFDGLADGNSVCAECGCLVDPAYENEHISWHRRVEEVESSDR